MVTTTFPPIRTQTSLRFPGRAWAISSQAVGAYFASMAVLNSVHTVRIAPDFFQWMHDNTWFPPYRPLLGALKPVAPAVVLGSAALQAVLGYHLLRGRRIPGALRWAQAWVLGLIPALSWPYWSLNAVSAVVFEIIRRGVKSHPSA